MAQLEWGPALEVGHGRIDGDHRTLIDALNRLRAARDEGRAREEIEAVLGFLRDYTVSHFQAEEALMIQHRYPQAADHFSAHSGLVLQVSDFIDAHRAGRAVLTDALLEFLEHWLVDHIQVKDRALGAFLRDRGVVG